MKNNELNNNRQFIFQKIEKLVISIIILILLLIILFLSVLLLKNKKDLNNTAIGSGGAVVASTNSGEEVIYEDVFLIYKNNPLIFSEETLSGFISVGKKFNQNIIPVLSNDDRIKSIVKLAGKNMYYPMFVFSQNSSNIKYNDIPKDNLYIDEKNKLFAINEPILLNLPKIVIPRTEEINNLINKYSLSGKNESKNNETFILVIEDPLCPYCAQTYLDQEIQKTLKDFPIKYLYYPLNVPGHENSNKLIGLLRANNNNEELLNTIFKNQKSLAGTGIILNDKIKTLLKENNSKLNIKDGKDMEYTNDEIEEIKNLLLKLGVLGTPTYFIVNKEEIILVGNFNLIKFILEK